MTPLPHYSPALLPNNRALCDDFMKIGTLVELGLQNTIRLGPTSILAFNVVFDKVAF